MAYRDMKIASVVVVGATAAIGVLASARLPAGTQLPTHWNAAGEADRFADAGTALMMPVALTIVTALLCSAIPAIEPLQHRLDKSEGLLRAVWAALLAVMLLVELIVAGPAFGWTPPATLPLIGIGVLLVVIGNALPKSRPGFLVGIRTPWTLIDPDNWIATHRLGARTMVAGGVAIVAAALIPLAADARAAVTIGALAVAVVPPVAYSFWFYWSRRRAA